MLERKEYTFTSESVSEGHPDKICDRISDAILDAFLKEDPYARLGCETFATTDRIVIGGEVRGPGSVMRKIEDIARECVREIGYEQQGFHWANLKVDSYLHAQSVDIAQGVDASDSKDEGAGDQGIMFGYATTETEALMPAPVQYAHAILRRLSHERKHGGATQLGPDAKSQLSVRYENGKPVGVDSIVCSTQHLDASMSSQDIRDLIEPFILDELPTGWITPATTWHINPTGKFVIGGPDGDAGLTGRKIIVDTYGGAAPHGGGAFSGKDPTKVDRSAAYAARYLAKNIVGAGLAEKCVIQLSYAIGVSQPTSIYIDTFGTGKFDVQKLENKIPDILNLSPRGIREHLQLNKPIYERTAAYGHFGRKTDSEGGFSWEKLDLVDELKSICG